MDKFTTCQSNLGKFTRLNEKFNALLSKILRQHPGNQIAQHSVFVFGYCGRTLEINIAYSSRFPQWFGLPKIAF
ncbi:MAG: hypothetical protein MJA27_34575 [Pseudanabaenales cyanobacterium]|nr:hypothetical protein [Pseudanabaenales cyanobacterium]